MSKNVKTALIVTICVTASLALLHVTVNSLFPLIASMHSGMY